MSEMKKEKEECCRYYGVIGFLNIRQAAEFLGGRSVRWVRSHLHEIPHRKLYDRLLFDPLELRAYVEACSERHLPIDIDAIVAQVLGPRRQRVRMKTGD
ncbi:MAG: hypothetical protein A2Z03_07765 [Chloroflexi bacterium RBG_16_56_8]|nr:MAG: hypothetical protein A2Z03_07765 [Chloroflexi bacterium RBG_16_56_8]